MGRGNAGKSTLINALNSAYEGTGGEEMAYVSRNKGKTWQLNFYLAKHRFRKRTVGMLVDSPGFGRTAAPVKLKQKWQRMMRKYLSYGVRLNLILFCVQANHGLTREDLMILEELKYFQKPVHFVLTKIDKVKNNEKLYEVLTEAQQIQRKYDYFIKPDIHLVSAKEKFGMPELRARVGIAFELDNYLKFS